MSGKKQRSLWFRRFKEGLSISLIIFITFSNLHGQQPWPWHNNKGKQLTIMLFGDTNLQNREDPKEAFKNVLPTLQQADVKIINLEGPLAGTSLDPRIPDIPHKSDWKHSQPEMVKGLVQAGINIAGVANNVTYPWMALLKSLKVLKENNIRYAGGGENIKEAHAPVILEKNGVRIGFLSYACTVFPYQHAATDNVPGIASVRVDTYYKPHRALDKPGSEMTTVTIPQPEELNTMRNDIKNLRTKADIIIASYHWGVSENDTLLDYQVTIAHEAIEAGADVIMGHGNHMVEAIETYKTKPIFYGLGNFAFNWDKMRDRKKEGLAVKLDIKNNKLDRICFVPLMRDEHNNPVFLDPNTGAGATVINKVKDLTGNLSSLKVEGKEVVVTSKFSISGR